MINQQAQFSFDLQEISQTQEKLESPLFFLLEYARFWLMTQISEQIGSASEEIDVHTFISRFGPKSVCVKGVFFLSTRQFEVELEIPGDVLS